MTRQPPTSSIYDRARKELSFRENDAARAVFEHRRDPGSAESLAARRYSMELDDYAADLSRAELTGNLLPPLPTPPYVVTDLAAEEASRS